MPCDLSLHSHAKNSKNPHIDVGITDIVLNISPSTIGTMAAVSTGFAATAVCTESGGGDGGGVMVLFCIRFWTVVNTVSFRLMQLQLLSFERYVLKLPVSFLGEKGGHSSRYPLILFRSRSLQVHDYGSSGTSSFYLIMMSEIGGGGGVGQAGKMMGGGEIKLHQ